MVIINLLALAVLVTLSAIVLYLYFLAIVGLTRSKEYPELSGNYDFLILVPAHNEEQVISRTLQSLKRLESVGALEIAVIADNCVDRTAPISREFNVTVLERTDARKLGKGYALEWALAKYDLDNFHGVVIVDADTVVESDMIKAIARSFEAGAGAVQLYYGLSIELETPLSYLQQMANIVENTLFYKARSILGLPILLRGTGMAIRSDVLKVHPWNAYSITEDVEYAISLLVAGIKIDFSTESSVFAATTSSYQQSKSQKTRWASGTFKLIREKMFPLIRTGLSQNRPDLIELSFSFLLLSRPLLIYIAIIPLFLGVVGSPDLTYTLSIWSVILISLLILYLASGIMLMPEKKSALKSLLQIPFYGLWFLIIQLKAISKRGKMRWEKTKRKVNE